MPDTIRHRPLQATYTSPAPGDADKRVAPAHYSAVVSESMASFEPSPAGRSVPLLGADVLTGCGHRLYLDTAYHALLRDVAEPVGVTLRRDAARSHRDGVRARLAEERPAMVVVDSGIARTDRIEQTLRSCGDGAELIWGAALPDDRETGRRWRAEALLADPAGGYLPVLVVNHKVVDPGVGALVSSLDRFDPRIDPTRKPRPHLRDQLMLVQARLILERHGLAAVSGYGAVIGHDGESMIVHRAADSAAEYHRRFDERMAIATGRRITGADRISECRSCPWWSECERVLSERHDISLIAPGGRGEALRAAGITTIDQLADRTGDPPAGWAPGDFADIGVIARAWLQQIPLVRRRARVTVTRADVEIDVDMECYQEFGAYLWGALEWTDRGERYHPFVTWEPLPTEDEARSFAEFWRWLMGRRALAHARGQTFAAYCYSRFAEDKWLLESARRFLGRPGIPTVEEIRAFIDSPEWVDMFEAVGNNFIAPGGRGLKKLAPMAGFAWRDDEAGGEASMAWYRRAVGYDESPDIGQRTRLLEYNEDDVRATRALRVWMSTRAADEVPLIAPPSAARAG